MYEATTAYAFNHYRRTEKNNCVFVVETNATRTEVDTILRPYLVIRDQVSKMSFILHAKL